MRLLQIPSNLLPLEVVKVFDTGAVRVRSRREWGGTLYLDVTLAELAELLEGHGGDQKAD